MLIWFMAISERNNIRIRKAMWSLSPRKPTVTLWLRVCPVSLVVISWHLHLGTHHWNSTTVFFNLTCFYLQHFCVILFNSQCSCQTFPLCFWRGSVYLHLHALCYFLSQFWIDFLNLYSDTRVLWSLLLLEGRTVRSLSYFLFCYFPGLRSWEIVVVSSLASLHLSLFVVFYTFI